MKKKERSNSWLKRKKTDSLLKLKKKINNKDLTAIQDLLKKEDIDINSTIEGKTILSLAVEIGASNIVRTILDLNKKNEEALQTIEKAKKEGNIATIIDLILSAKQYNVEVVSLLLKEKEQNIKIQEFFSVLKKSNIIFVKPNESSPVVDINAQNKDKSTALYIAVEKGNYELAQLLMNYYADVNIINRSTNKNALWIAIERNDPKMVEILLSFNQIMSDKHKVQNECFTQGTDGVILDYALGTHNTNKVLDKTNKPILSLAIEQENKDIIKLLVKNGASINFSDALNESPLWFALNKGNLDIIKCLLDSYATANKEIKNEELEPKNLNLNINKKGITPLEFAIKNDNKGLIKTLLEYFSKDNNLLNEAINEENKEGKPPLWIAIEQKNLKIVKLLVEKGKAAVDYVLPEKKQALLSLAIKQANAKKTTQGEEIDIVKYLLKAGANLDYQAVNSKTPREYMKQNCKEVVIDFIDKYEKKIVEGKFTPLSFLDVPKDMFATNYKAIDYNKAREYAKQIQKDKGQILLTKSIPQIENDHYSPVNDEYLPQEKNPCVIIDTHFSVMGDI